MNRCKTCKYWSKEPAALESPESFFQDSGERPLSEEQIVEKFGYTARLCTHPKIVFDERPAADGATLVDGERYRAEFITAQEFGCVLHEEKQS